MALAASALLHSFFLFVLLQPTPTRRSHASVVAPAEDAESVLVLIAPGAASAERPLPAGPDARGRRARRPSPALPSSRARAERGSATSPEVPGGASAAGLGAAATAAERLRVRSGDSRLWPSGEALSAPRGLTQAVESRLYTGIRAIMDSTMAARRGLLYAPNRGCGSAGESCGIGAPGEGVPSALGNGATLMPVEVSRARADATPLRRDPQTRATAAWLLTHDAAFQAELRRIIGARVQAMRARADSARRNR